MASKSEVFSSRWGMLLAMLGMAVGTGNIWRFPRIAASNGGGSFLVAWAVFLLLWSVPLLILEFGMGKGTRMGTVGAFAKTHGAQVRLDGGLGGVDRHSHHVLLQRGHGMDHPLLLGHPHPGDPHRGARGVLGRFRRHALGSPDPRHRHEPRGLGGVPGDQGDRSGRPRFLIPSLIVLVIVLAVKAITLPGSSRGLAFLFTPNLADLANYRVWLEALTQNAWDTGAGWGLALTYAVYMRKREDTALNAFVVGFGNNSMSLLAGIMVLCTVFSIMPDAAGQIVGAGNEGLTFIWVPQLFARIPWGQFFMAIFFLALVFAAWTSLVSMIELASRILQDTGCSPGPGHRDRGSGGSAVRNPQCAQHGLLPEPGLRVGRGAHALGILLRGRGSAVRRHQMA